MRNYLTLGPTPAAEDCQQVGPNIDHNRERQELYAYKHQLERILYAHDPDYVLYGVSISVKAFDHDFGTYHEAVVNFLDENERAVELAFWLDENSPEHWDEDALADLKCQVLLRSAY